ncbi:MAG TPA: substrate-binding domain-containing protein [Solirubrobacteraceae bacterium]|nr:substrate-binding domain-containing protein [Solirubrobacteraceae bacterium]
MGALLLVLSVAALAVAAGPSFGKAHAAASKVDVGVLLPDTQSSVRWETQDRPALNKAFKAAGVSVTIVNAHGDASTQRTQADQALTNGAKVLLLVDLDSGSGKAIISAAHKKGAKVIDYDRLTLGGDSDYYVSYDNAKVGGLQGRGLVKCIGAAGLKKPVVAELNGSPTDNNATLFAQGYNAVLNPKYKSGAYVKGPNQSVPDWDNQKALTIFEQMLQQTNNKIDAVLAANDGLANSVISALKARKLGNLPVTGQDATVQGLQHILAGEQCMTVFKSSTGEAGAAAKIAIALVKGQKPKTTGTVKSGSKTEPAVLLPPVSITKSNISTVIKSGEQKRSDICKGKYAALCKKAGL